MPASPDDPSPPSQHTTGVPFPDASPPSWLDNFVELIATRIALIEAETRGAAASGAGRVIRIVISGFLAVVAWLLLMAAAAGLLHAITGLAWYWGCLILGAAHLATIAILLHQARKPGPPTYQHTRAEFQKDREWLLNLKNRKSQR